VLTARCATCLHHHPASDRRIWCAQREVVRETSICFRHRRLWVGPTESAAASTPWCGRRLGTMTFPRCRIELPAACHARPSAGGQSHIAIWRPRSPTPLHAPHRPSSMSLAPRKTHNLPHMIMAEKPVRRWPLTPGPSSVDETESADGLAATSSRSRVGGSSQTPRSATCCPGVQPADTTTCQGARHRCTAERTSTGFDRTTPRRFSCLTPRALPPVPSENFNGGPVA